MKEINTIAIGISGASGIPYGLRLLEFLLSHRKKVFLMISPAAREVFRLETEIELPDTIEQLQDFFIKKFKADPKYLRVLATNEWTAPVASGSSLKIEAMVICPCSSSCLSAIAHGASNNLLERSADVMIKEKRPLILVHRETPLSVIHIENMLKLAQIGVTILPASPGFYHRPQTLQNLIDFIVGRILNQLNIENTLSPQWGGNY